MAGGGSNILYYEPSTPSPFKKFPEPLTKKSGFPRYEQDFIVHLRKQVGYVLELTQPTNPEKQLHIFDVLMGSVDGPEGRRKLTHMSKTLTTIDAAGRDAWAMLKTFYQKNTGARQPQLYHDMSTPQKAAESLESYVDRVIQSAGELGEIGEVINDTSIKNTIYRGINPVYGPYISHLERNRMEMALDDYKEELLSAARIYEDLHKKTVQLDSTAAHHSSVPDALGYQAPPDHPTSQRVSSMTKVTPTVALKQLLSKYAPNASAHDMARLERMFLEITT